MLLLLSREPSSKATKQRAQKTNKRRLSENRRAQTNNYRLSPLLLDSGYQRHGKSRLLFLLLCGLPYSQANIKD